MSSRVSLCRCGHGSETPTASKVAFALQYKTIFRLDFSLSHSNQRLFPFTYLTHSLFVSPFLPIFSSVPKSTPLLPSSSRKVPKRIFPPSRFTG